MTFVKSFNEILKINELFVSILQSIIIEIERLVYVKKVSVTILLKYEAPVSL